MYQVHQQGEVGQAAGEQLEQWQKAGWPLRRVTVMMSTLAGENRGLKQSKLSHNKISAKCREPRQIFYYWSYERTEEICENRAKEIEIVAAKNTGGG